MIGFVQPALQEEASRVSNCWRTWFFLLWCFGLNSQASVKILALVFKKRLLVGFASDWRSLGPNFLYSSLDWASSSLAINEEFTVLILFEFVSRRADTELRLLSSFWRLWQCCDCQDLMMKVAWMREDCFLSSLFLLTKMIHRHFSFTWLGKSPWEALSLLELLLISLVSGSCSVCSRWIADFLTAIRWLVHGIGGCFGHPSLQEGAAPSYEWGFQLPSSPGLAPLISRVGSNTVVYSCRN